MLETVPQDVPAQPVPLMVQFTAVFADPVTVAWNCCCAPVFSAVLFGEIVIPTAVPEEPRVTLAVAVLGGVESSVAVTVTLGGFGAAAGAVYKPPAVMLPQVIPAQPLPETLQRTTPLLPVVENWTWPPSLICGALGEIVSVPDEPILTDAVPDCAGTATDVAFTVTVAGFGAVAGAV